jgi:hypothetical protein
MHFEIDVQSIARHALALGIIADVRQILPNVPVELVISSFDEMEVQFGRAQF